MLLFWYDLFNIRALFADDRGRTILYEFYIVRAQLVDREKGPDGANRSGIDLFYRHPFGGESVVIQSRFPPLQPILSLIDESRQFAHRDRARFARHILAPFFFRNLRVSSETQGPTQPVS